jgi:mRNA interferase HigB
MRIVNEACLEACKHKHADSRGALNTWRRFVSDARWKNPMDVRQVYNSADFIGKGCAIFDIKGNKYRIVVKINYQRQLVRVLFAGTHPEYDKVNAAELCGGA